MTPTAHTLALLRREGYIAAVVEKWLPRVNLRQDVWGFGDVLAAHPVGRVVLIVQATTKLTAPLNGLPRPVTPSNGPNGEQSDYVTYCDAEGRFADFHSLRHTNVSRIVQGARPRRPHKCWPSIPPLP